MYLLDTSIILELLLEQEKADEVEQFLRKTLPDTFYLSEFTLYSIGIVLMHAKKHETFLRWAEDLLVNSGVRLIRLGIEDMKNIVKISRKFNLDFDDAYQYTAAEKYNLTIVSFDKDFDRTDRRRKSPAELLVSA